MCVIPPGRAQRRAQGWVGGLATVGTQYSERVLPRCGLPVAFEWTRVQLPGAYVLKRDLPERLRFAGIVLHKTGSPLSQGFHESYLAQHRAPPTSPPPYFLLISTDQQLSDQAACDRDQLCPYFCSPAVVDELISWPSLVIGPFLKERSPESGA